MKIVPLIIRFIIVILPALGLRMALALISLPDPVLKAINYRPFIAAIGPGPFAISLMAITYAGLCLVLYFLQRHDQAKDYKGAFGFFGITVLLWYLGNFEASLLPGISLLDEVIFGTMEALPLLLLCFLYQTFLGVRQSKDGRPRQRMSKPAIFPAVIMAGLCLLAGRYITLALFGENLLFPQGNPAVLLMTIGRASLTGLLFQRYGHGLGKNIRSSAFLFGFFIFGLDWFCFNLFAPLLFDFSSIDVITLFVFHPLLDSFLLSTGFWILNRQDKGEMA